MAKSQVLDEYERRHEEAQEVPFCDELSALEGVDGWKKAPTYGLRETVNTAGLYFGKQKNGEHSHLATAYVASYNEGKVSWDIVKLDKWGGIGSRAPMAYGDGPPEVAIPAMLERIEQIKIRQSSQRSK